MIGSRPGPERVISSACPDQPLVQRIGEALLVSAALGAQGHRSLDPGGAPGSSCEVVRIQSCARW